MLEFPLNTLRIQHKTVYRYRQPVSLGPHRLLLRPRESRDLRLLASEIVMAPTAAATTWAEDVFGNAVAVATFEGMTDGRTIESKVELELGGQPWPVFPVAASAISYPFLYADDEWTDLGALAMQQHEDPTGRLRTWTREVSCAAIRPIPSPC